MNDDRKMDGIAIDYRSAFGGEDEARQVNALRAAIT